MNILTLKFSLRFLPLVCFCLLSGCFDDLVKSSASNCTVVVNNKTGEESGCLTNEEAQALQSQQLDNLINDAIIEITGTLSDYDRDENEKNVVAIPSTPVDLETFRSQYNIPPDAILINVSDLDDNSNIPQSINFSNTSARNTSYASRVIYFINLGDESVKFAMRIASNDNYSYEINGPFTGELAPSHYQISSIEFKPANEGYKQSNVELFFSNNQQIQIQLTGNVTGDCIIEDFTFAISKTTTSDVCIWYGKHVAFVIEQDNPLQRDSNQLTHMLRTLDLAYKTYTQTTYFAPNQEHTYNDRAVIEINDAVAENEILSIPGYAGFAISKAFFNSEYQRYIHRKKIWSLAWFRGIGTNFLTSDLTASIDYTLHDNSNTYGWWRRALNETLALSISDYLSIEVDEGGKNTNEIKAFYTDQLSTYINNPDLYNWDNTFVQRILPWSEKTELDSLLTGILLELYNNNQTVFLSSYFLHLKNLPALSDAQDYQTARNNFYQAARTAGIQNIYNYLTTTLRWEITDTNNK